LGSLSRVSVLQLSVAGSEGDSHLSEADMDSHYLIGEAVWIAAGIIMLLAFGDALVLLALALASAAMTTAWWTHRKAQQREPVSDADLAPVSRLRPTSAIRREPKSALAQAPWRGPSAA
jgi:hypothetical protein